MRYCAIALILLLTACTGKVVKEPYPVEIVVYKQQRLPEELLRPCPVHEQTERSVDAYVTTAITNTPALRVCAKQIEEIRKLQPED